MSGNAPVDPAEIPVFTGDLAVLDEQVKLISSGGATVSTKASDVHTSFGGLQAFYQAPEADQLFATTKPVSDLGLKLSSDMCTIAGALGTYSRDAAPVIKKLENLRAEAEAFRSKVADDDKWREDGDLIDENLERRNKVAEVWEEFHEVERAAHAKIVALVGGKPLRINDGSNAPDMYGYDPEALKQSKSLPWGDAVEESIPGWQVWEHVWEFGKGFFVDGVWGTLKGLGGLVGLQGWDTFKQSWAGLAKLGTGLSIAMIPGVGALYMAVPDDKLPAYLRESRTAMKETGKALLAWDQWGSNPGRAAGAVTFNVITTIATGGTGGAVSGAGKAGAVAKALSVAGKAGRIVDPMTYVFKGAGAGISKIGDVMAALRGMGKIEAPSINLDGAIALPEGAVRLPDGAIHLPTGSAVPDGAIKLSDGNIKLPENTTTFPPGTVKLPTPDGTSRFMDIEGNIYKADGSLEQSGKHSPKEPSPDTDAGVPRTEAPKVDTPSTARVPERELASVGARGGDNGINLGSHISDPVHAIDNAPRGVDATPVRVPEHELAGVGGRGGDHAPGGNANHHGTGPSASHEPPAGGGHTDGPSTGGGHDGSPAGGASHADSPTGGHGDGSGSGGHGGDGGGAGHRPGGEGAGDSLPEGAADMPEQVQLPGKSEVRPDGARYIEEPDDALAARFYDEVRADPQRLDIASISNNTGISTSVLDRVRTHFFGTQHVVAEAPGAARHAYFTPRRDIADIWQAAAQGRLTPEEALKFERYIAHEYAESQFIEAGIPYVRDEPHLWESYANADESGFYHNWPESWADAGAHELAASERRGGFGHWGGLDLDVPMVELAPGLSNIDEVMAALFQELRSKGIELK
ncbi:hypothetical protein [Streptomyces yangpuensis]|uniref:hypothetical protein n=1 Tax=Streptomyces yangpuensis TaxID=1648182 RepID=UPI0036AF26EC